MPKKTPKPFFSKDSHKGYMKRQFINAAICAGLFLLMVLAGELGWL